MVFFVYEPGSAAYRVYDPARQCIHITRDVVFDEEASWNWTEPGVVVDSSAFTVDYYTHTVARASPHAASPAATGSGQQNSASSPVQVEPKPEPASDAPAPSPPPRASSPEAAEPLPLPRHSMTTRSRNGIVQLKSYEDYVMVHEDDLDYVMVEEEELNLRSIDEPHSFAEAEQDASWRRAMDEEMASIIDNKTWRLVDLPAGSRPIGLKWVYKLKRDANGDVHKYKARLVAKGYVQTLGVDFKEVFAPVSRLESVRLLLTLAAQEGWSVHHMDVKSAFLNSELKEEVYVEQPPGFAVVG